MDDGWMLQTVAEDLAAFANYGRADYVHVLKIAEPHGSHNDPLEHDLYELARRVLAAVPVEFSDRGDGVIDVHGLEWPRLTWAIVAARILWMRYRADVGPELPDLDHVIELVNVHEHRDEPRRDTRPPPTVLLADTLARHAPPFRDLTRSIREAAAA